MTKHMISIYLDAFTPEISGDRDSTGEFYFVTRSGMNSHRWPIEKELKLEAGITYDEEKNNLLHSLTTEKEEIDVEFLVAEKDWGQDDLFLQIIKRIEIEEGIIDFELANEGYCSMKIRVATSQA